jgi:hypothetical protein
MRRCRVRIHGVGLHLFHGFHRLIFKMRPSRIADNGFLGMNHATEPAVISNQDRFHDAESYTESLKFTIPALPRTPHSCPLCGTGPQTQQASSCDGWGWGGVQRLGIR